MSTRDRRRFTIHPPEGKKDEIGDLSVSQNEIEIRDHCTKCDTWEHGIGYLLYATEFPTRIDMVDLINSFEVVFPDHFGKEWGQFQAFRDNVKNFTSIMDRLDASTQDQLMDRLYFEFVKKIKKWLQKGIDEPIKEKDLPRTPEIKSGIDLDQTLKWRRLQNETKTMKAARAKIARRKNKDDYIVDRHRKRGPYKNAQNEYIEIKQENGNVTRRVVRRCPGPGCTEILGTRQFFCSNRCYDADYYLKNPGIVAKHFPNFGQKGQQ